MPSLEEVLKESRARVSALNNSPYSGIWSNPTKMDWTPYIEKINKERARAGQDKWGDSKYDYGIRSFADLDRLDDIRAMNQPGYVKILNGLGKMTTTAATTFANGTVGTLWGVGKGLANMFDGDETTTFRQGLWDNEFNKAMGNIQEKMEKILPNYYTEAEMNDPWYQHIFSANFLGDKLLKNAGFTIGAMATMAVPGFNSAFGLAKGMTAAAKAFGATAKTIRGVQNAGKVATVLGNSFISANGEANIEAYNAVKSFTEPQLEYLTERIQSGKDEAEKLRQQAIESGVAPSIALQEYNKRIAFLDDLQRRETQAIQDRATDVGNTTWKGNVIALMISNNLEFGRMIRGGYGMSKGLGNILLRDGEKEVTQQGLGRAIAAGTANAAVKESKHDALKVTGNWIKNMASEGTEELTQNLISGTAQATNTAELEKARAQKLKSDADKYSIFASSLNPELTSEYTDTFKALSKIWDDEFGTIDKRGWEEFVLGAITGGLGTISVRRADVRNGSNRVKIGWQGGIAEAIRDVRESRKDDEVKLEQIKALIEDLKIVERTKRAVASMSIAQDMDEALQNDDIFRFKNSELMALANDALRFKKEGMLDAYKSFYKSIADGLTDADVESLRLLTSQAIENESVETKGRFKTYLDELDSDKIKHIYQQKAKSNLAKIENVVQTYDDLYTLNYDKFRKHATPEQQSLIDWALQDIAAEKALVEDLRRRRTKLITDKAEKSEIDKINKTIQKLEEDINESLRNPSHKLEALEKVQRKYAKRLIGQDKEKTIERYKNASSLQDIIDTYFHNKTADGKEVTDVDNLFADRSDDAEDAFLQALNESEGEQKERLKKFLPFITNVRSLRNAVSRIIDSVPEDLKGAVNAGMTRVLDASIEQFLNDNTNTFSNLKQKITDMINNLPKHPMMDLIKPFLRNAVSEMDDVDNATNSEGEIQRRLDELEKQTSESSDTDVSQSSAKNDNTSEGSESNPTKDNDNDLDDDDAGLWTTDDEESGEKILEGTPEESPKPEEDQEPEGEKTPQGNEDNDETPEGAKSESQQSNPKPPKAKTEEKKKGISPKEIWQNVQKQYPITGEGIEMSDILQLDDKHWGVLYYANPTNKGYFIFDSMGRAAYKYFSDGGSVSGGQALRMGDEEALRIIKDKYKKDPIVKKFFAKSKRKSSDRIGLDGWSEVRSSMAKDHQTFQESGWQKTFKENGYDFDITMNEVLPYLLRQKDADKIVHLGVYSGDNETLSNYIYTGYKVNDSQKDTIQKRFKLDPKHFIKSNGTNYLVVGPMMFRSGVQQETENMIKAVKDFYAPRMSDSDTITFAEDAPNTTINEVSNGSIVYNYNNREMPEFGNSIGDLLVDDPLLNPFGYNKNSIQESNNGIRFVNVYQDIDQPTQLNTIADTAFGTISNNVIISRAFAGETYMILANSNVPIKISTITFNDLWNKDNKSEWSDIINPNSKYIKDLNNSIHNLMYPEQLTKEGFIKSFHQFGKYFHITNILGTQFSTFDDAVKAIVGGEYVKNNKSKLGFSLKAKFSEHPTEQQRQAYAKAILKMLEQINPRIAMNHTSTAESNSINNMINSGLIRARIARLGTVNKGLFVNPMIIDNAQVVEDKTFDKSVTEDKRNKNKTKSIKGSVWVKADIGGTDYKVQVDTRNNILNPGTIPEQIRNVGLRVINGEYERYEYKDPLNGSSSEYLVSKKATKAGKFNVLHLIANGRVAIINNTDIIKDVLNSYLQSKSDETIRTAPIEEIINFDDDSALDDTTNTEVTPNEPSNSEDSVKTESIDKIKGFLEDDNIRASMKGIPELRNVIKKWDATNTDEIAETIYNLRSGWNSNDFANYSSFSQYFRNCKK